MPACERHCGTMTDPIKACCRLTGHVTQGRRALDSGRITHTAAAPGCAAAASASEALGAARPSLCQGIPNHALLLRGYL